MPRVLRILRRTAGRALLLMFGLLAAEAALQAACALSPDVAAKLSGLKPRYVSDPVLGVRGDAALAEYDHDGFRNAMRPEQAAVVAIGDSQTEGSGVEREHAWPQRLAARTGREVYQMAFGSYGPGQYRVLADRALELRPGVLLVGIYAGNDLLNMYEWVYLDGRSPDLRSSDAGVLAAMAAADARLGPVARVWRQTRAAKKGDLAAVSLFGGLSTGVIERSKLVALARRLAWRLRNPGSWRERDRTEGDWDDIRRRAEGAPPGLLFAFESGTLRTVLTPAARRAAVDLSDPRIAEGLRMTVAALRQIQRTSADRARLIVVDLPTKELVYGSEVRHRLGGLPPEYAALMAEETAVHAALARALAAAGIERVDARPALEAVLAGGRNPYPTDWDGHPNALGHDAIAAAVAALVRESPAVARQPPHSETGIPASQAAELRPRSFSMRPSKRRRPSRTVRGCGGHPGT